MHLTINEISVLIDTWNGWYLLSHDEKLLSDHSENKIRIIITPFSSKFMTEEIKKDLLDYTDDLKYEDGRFEIGFNFEASEHQTEDILKAIKPILEKTEGSEFEYINAMKFTEENLPEEDAKDSQLNENIRNEIEKYIQMQKQEKKAEDTDNPKTGEEPDNAQEKAVDIPMPYNSIIIKGKINNDYIDINEILHNDLPIEQQEVFLEASRLYETVLRNFDTEKSNDNQLSFECTDEAESALASLHLGTCLDFGKVEYKGKVVKCACLPEELAAVISFVRYRKQFSLFDNPLLGRLKARKKRLKEAQKALVKKSCSCLLFAFSIFLFMVFIWLIMNKPKH